MKHCPKCNSLMPGDAPRCIKCGSESHTAATDLAKKSAAEKPLPANATQGPRRINWMRISAAVLTSKLFFVASCSVGTILAGATDSGVESGTHGGKVRPLDPRMAIIALVPVAEKPGATKVVQTSLRDLEKFKQDNPESSFVPPLGRGELEGPSVLMRTEYSVTADGPGRVMVETQLHDDEHHTLGRYAATDKEIKPLYTRFKHDFVSFMTGFALGLPLAIVLGLIGSFLNWRLKLAAGGVTVAAGTASGLRRLGRLIALTCMWFLIFVVVVVVIVKLVVIFS